MRLEGKTAIVTGAAQGIGREYALRFAREGAAVAIVDLREQEAEATSIDITSAGGRAVAIKADVTNEEEMSDAAGRVAGEFGTVDILVNNAALYGDMNLGDQSVVPLWGKPEDGTASDKTVNNTVLSDIAAFLAKHGVAPGAYIYVADAALVTEDNLAALGDTLCITRLPATYNECGRLIAEAVAHNTWEDVGVLARTKPTKHRAATAYKVYEGEVTLYGTAYRAVVVHSSAQDKRRQQRLARDIQTSYSTMQTTARAAEHQEYFCRADAEAAAAQLRAVHAVYHGMEVTVEERPVYGRGRPSAHKPRPIKAMRYRLKTAISPQTERMARLEEEAGCFVLLTNVPTAGDLAHSARDILTVYKDQHGTEQNYGFLKDPVIVNSLCLKKPERIEALGLILLLALLLWRLMERTMRTYVDTTRTPLPGWDKKATERPTAFMMITKFAGVIVFKCGHDRQLARPLSVVQQQYLTALDVPATCFTLPTG